jgi:hypothetical protein
MTRTNAALISIVATFVIAFSAIPAVADIGGYYRSPEAVLAASGESSPQPPYRSPESVLAAAGETSPQPQYRSPESVLAAAGETSPQLSPSVEASSDDAFDWGDAGIGAAAMLGLLGLGSGAVLVSGLQRRRTATS